MIVADLHDAVQGNSALQSALQRRLCKEVTELNGQPAVDLLVDLEKNVCLHRLLDMAQKQDFPKRLFHMAIQA